MSEGFALKIQKVNYENKKREDHQTFSNVSAPSSTVKKTSTEYLINEICISIFKNTVSPSDIAYSYISFFYAFRKRFLFLP